MGRASVTGDSRTIIRRAVCAWCNPTGERLSRARFPTEPRSLYDPFKREYCNIDIPYVPTAKRTRIAV